MLKLFTPVFSALAVCLALHSPAAAESSDDLLKELSNMAKDPSAQKSPLSANVPQGESTPLAAQGSEPTLRVDPAQDFVFPENPDFSRLVESLTPLANKEDVAEFNKKLEALKDTIRPRGLLVITQPAEKRDFSTLSAEEARAGGSWYSAPESYLTLDPEWISYFANTVTPKLDALLRPLAVKVLESDETLTITKTSGGSLTVRLGDDKVSDLLKTIPRNADYAFFYCWTPTRPEEFRNLKEGRAIHTRFTLYCLPKPYAVNQSYKVNYINVFMHLYDSEKRLIPGKKQRVYDMTWTPGVTNSAYKPGWGLSWAFRSRNGILYVALRMPELRGKYTDSFHVPADRTYGGIIATFRKANECFE